MGMVAHAMRAPQWPAHHPICCPPCPPCSPAPASPSTQRLPTMLASASETRTPHRVVKWEKLDVGPHGPLFILHALDAIDKSRVRVLGRRPPPAPCLPTRVSLVAWAVGAWTLAATAGAGAGNPCITPVHGGLGPLRARACTGTAVSLPTCAAGEGWTPMALLIKGFIRGQLRRGWCRPLFGM